MLTNAITLCTQKNDGPNPGIRLLIDTIEQKIGTWRI